MSIKRDSKKNASTFNLINGVDKAKPGKSTSKKMYPEREHGLMNPILQEPSLLKSAQRYFASVKTPIAPEPDPLETMIAEPIATERRIVPPIILKPEKAVLSPRIDPSSP